MIMATKITITNDRAGTSAALWVGAEVDEGSVASVAAIF